MKVSNVSFGIRYDRNTFNVLTRAKLNGLNTEKLEDNLADLRAVAPKKTLYTDSAFQDPTRIYSMCVADSRISKEKDWILPLEYEKSPKSIKVDQNLIDEITKNLQEYKKILIPQIYMSDKGKAEKELIEKLGLPV